MSTQEIRFSELVVIQGQRLAGDQGAANNPLAAKSRKPDFLCAHALNSYLRVFLGAAFAACLVLATALGVAFFAGALVTAFFTGLAFAAAFFTGLAFAAAFFTGLTLAFVAAFFAALAAATAFAGAFLVPANACFAGITLL